MKTTDFLDFFEFETSLTTGGRGNGIKENQCSVLHNSKNKSYYFRFQGLKYKFLKIGKAQGNIFFVLNNKEGIIGKSFSGSGKTTSFSCKQAVLSMLTLLTSDFKNQINYKCVFEFEIVSENSEEKVLKFVKKN